MLGLQKHCLPAPLFFATLAKCPPRSSPVKKFIFNPLAAIWFKPKVGLSRRGETLNTCTGLCQSDSTLGYAHIFILSDLNGILPLIGENTQLRAQ